MSANKERRLLALPYTHEGAVNRRLRSARQQEGLTQEEWRKRLMGDGYSVAKASVSEYERSMKKKRRGVPLPPSDYLARVSEIFKYRLEWLLYGTGESKYLDDDELAGAGLTEDALLEGTIFGDLPDLLCDIHWAAGGTRLSLLRMLSEAHRTLEMGAGPRESDRSPDEILTRLARQLAEMVPVEDEAFVEFKELPSGQRRQVALHVECLIYLLFRPFREADTSYVWSRMVSPDPGGTGERAED